MVDGFVRGVDRGCFGHFVVVTKCLGVYPATSAEVPPGGGPVASVCCKHLQSPTNWNNMQRVHKQCIKQRRKGVKCTDKKGKRYSFQKWGIVGLSW